jgi:hypothetical protein
MKNQQLQFDLEKLLSYDGYSYTDITTDYTEELGYILDIKDNSYFYDNEEDRNFDDNKFMELVKDEVL